MTSLLRAGVIGAGVFGAYHADKWAGLEGVAMSAVLDPDSGRAAALADRHGARPLADAAEFFAAVDLVSVASPAITHGEWALAALRAGKPVYVEKPLATDLDAADAIARESRQRGLTVACGFLERVALKCVGLLGTAERPVRFEAVRRGTPSPRNLDVSVVLDLMIHDLDLALAFGTGEPFAVEAEGAAVINGSADEVRAEVSFDDGLVALFDASRVAQAPERRIRLVYPSGEVEVDLLAGTVRSTAALVLDEAFAAAPQARDRLRTSLAAFLAAVRGEADRPIATAGDGVRALDLALAVQLALGE